MARAAGLLHDIGKCSAAFKEYICAERTVSKKVNHSTAGALEASRLYGKKLGRLLAFVIAGHHAGLADGEDLEGRLAQAPPSYDGWRDETGSLPSLAALTSIRIPKPGGESGFSVVFVIRMLFSCLVDADRLETASFYAEAGEGAADRVEGTPLAVLRDRLAAFMAGMTADADSQVCAETFSTARSRKHGSHPACSP